LHYEASHQHDLFVELTDAEFNEAWEAGAQIRQSSVDRGLRERLCAEDGMRVQQLGEVAALAIAKAAGLPWTPGMDTFKNADVVHNIEARMMGREWYGLRVYDRDNSTRRVVGCIIEPGREREPYRIPGWINAKFAKREEWRCDFGNRGKPVYAAPQSALFGFDELLRLIAKEKQPDILSLAHAAIAAGRAPEFVIGEWP
jgi:hypothetical protein